MKKNNINFKNINFSYIKTRYRYISNYKNKIWDNGKIISNNMILINECACVLQYAQSVFEGLKAYKMKNNKSVAIFRPNLNSKRIQKSSKRLEIPIFSKKYFMKALIKVIKYNIDYIPPYGLNAFLYIRPYIYGSSPIIGVKPSKEYQFRIFVIPVKSYFNLKFHGISTCISKFDRSAPNGTGNVKASLNYAMSIHSIVIAKNKGFDDNIYLDAKTRTKIEESNGANILFITKNNIIVTPKSNTILPSITKRSIIYIAKYYFGFKIEEREILLNELKNFVECGLCGTATILVPVNEIVYNKNKIIMKKHNIINKLYNTLTGIQYGKIKAPYGWIKIIK